MSPYRRRAAQAVVALPFITLPFLKGGAIARNRDLPLSAAQVDWIESNPVIDFVVQPDLRPLAFLSRGRQDGLAAALLQHASEWLGLSFRPVSVRDAADSAGLMARGTLDLVPVAGVTRARSERLLFTRPYLSLQCALYAPGDGPAKGAGWYEGRPVGVPAGYEHLEAALPVRVLRVPVDGVVDAIGRMARGEIEAALLPQALVAGRAAEPDMPRLHIAVARVASIPIAMGVRAGVPALCEVLDVFLDAFPSARMARLQRVWLGETVATARWSPWEKGAATGIGLALTTAAALAFHRRRKPGRPPG
jgi:hypothetical protein